jgi:hypothetical protein
MKTSKEKCVFMLQIVYKTWIKSIICTNSLLNSCQMFISTLHNRQIPVYSIHSRYIPVYAIHNRHIPVYLIYIADIYIVGWNIHMFMLSILETCDRSECYLIFRFLLSGNNLLIIYPRYYYNKMKNTTLSEPFTERVNIDSTNKHKIQHCQNRSRKEQISTLLTNTKYNHIRTVRGKSKYRLY